MSIKAMNWAWGRSLPPTPKLILMALADAADDEGVCWPAIRTLARKCSVSERTVQRTVKAFVNGGLLLVYERRRPDGRQTSNSYQLVLERYHDNVLPQGSGYQERSATGVTVRVTQPSQGVGGLVMSPQEPPHEYKKETPLLQSAEANYSIVFPRMLSSLERTSILSMAKDIPQDDIQLLVDELASALASGNTIRTTPLRWFQGVLRRYRSGQFIAAGAIETAKRRQQRQHSVQPKADQVALASKADAEPYLRSIRQALSSSGKP